MEDGYFYNFDGLYRFTLCENELILEHAASEHQWVQETFSYDEIHGEFHTDIHMGKSDQMTTVLALFPISTGYFGQDEEDEQIYPLTEALSAALASHNLPLKGAERLIRGKPDLSAPEIVKKTTERLGIYCLTLALIFAVCTGASVLLFCLIGTTAGGICAAIGSLCFLFCVLRLFPVTRRYLFFRSYFLLEEKTILYCDRLLVYYDDVLNFTETDDQLLIETELQFLTMEKEPWLSDVLKDRLAAQYNPYGKTLDEIRGLE